MNMPPKPAFWKSPTILAVLLFLVAFSCLLAPSFFSSKSIFAGDAPGLMPSEWGGVMPDHYTGNWYYTNSGLGEGAGATSLNPLRLMRDWVTFHPKHQEFTYLISSLLTFLGALFCLRGMGVPSAWRVPSALGFTFTGYSFGLIAGGHTGFFQMTAYSLFLIGFVHRAATRGALFYYAMAGTLLIWGISVQPDMMIPMAVIAFFFGLVLVIAKYRSLEVASAKGQLVKKTLLGGVVAALFFAIFGIGAFKFLFETVVPTRDREAGQTADQKWIFMTNWSLPPAEVSEFILPNIFGVDSETPSAPYWGSLGRAHNFDSNLAIVKQNYAQAQQQMQRLTSASPPQEQQRAQQAFQMAQQQYSQVLRGRNLRQHSMYLGVIPIVFALFACWWMIVYRKSSPDLLPEQSKQLRLLIRFWTVIAIIGLLFAFGRYTFVYKIPFSIPYLNKIRAPVKYIRFVELSLCFLSGIGFLLFAFMAAKIQSIAKAPEAVEPVKPSKKTKGKKAKKVAPTRAVPPKKHAFQKTFRTFSMGCLVMAGILIITLFGMAGSKSSLMDSWQSLGFGSAGNDLHAQIIKSIFHSILLFSILGALFWLGSAKRFSKRILMYLPWFLASLVAMDAWFVNRKLIRVRDKTAYHAANPVADKIHSAGPHGRTDNLTSQFNKLDPRSFNWVYHGVYPLRPSSGQTVKADTKSYFDALANNSDKLWTLTSTTSVLAKRSQAQSLLRMPGMKEVTGYSYGADQTVQEAGVGSGEFALLEKSNALPYASVYSDWVLKSATNVLEFISSDPAWQPEKQLVLEAGSDLGFDPKAGEPSAVEVIQKSPQKLVIKAVCDAPGVLLVNEKWHPDLVVKVNGKASPCLKANFLMRAVPLQAGENLITFTYQPYKVVFSLNLLASLVLLGWFILSWSKGRRLTATEHASV